jgi:flagellar biosynthesis protein FlhF
MKLQKFEADNMPDALRKVKAALGPDAVIMDTRSVRRPGVMGLGARECVQVWATTSPDAAAEMPAVPGGNGGNGSSAAAARLDTRLLTALHTRLGDLEAKLDLLTMAAAYGSGAWASRGAAASQLGDNERAAALTALARRLPVSGEISLGDTRVVALVGPTGAGKTLTVAKLAGRFAVTHKARVGVICADGFRAGAMGEMKAYCDLLGVPMSAARDEQEILEALAGQQDRDLVLIDTAGASQRNDRQLAELRALLQTAGADDVHLVLSASASHGACAEAVKRFARVGATHLVFTKLDESPEPAEALAAAIGSGKPISYLADGQAVPQDLRPADEAYLVDVLACEPRHADARAAGSQAA